MSSEVVQDHGHVGPHIPEGCTLPLNSKKLTADHIRVIAWSMELATRAATDEVRRRSREDCPRKDANHATYEWCYRGLKTGGRT